MTSAAALYAFFDSFGIPAYAATDTSKREFPYLTYDTPRNFFDQGEVSCAVNLYYKTDSESIPNAMAEKIAQAIGYGGMTIKFDNGLAWLKRGTPFCQQMDDETDKSIKRRYINISIEYLTV